MAHGIMKTSFYKDFRDMLWSDMSESEKKAFAFVMAYHCDTDATAETMIGFNTPIWFGKNWRLPQAEFEVMFSEAKRAQSKLDKATIKQLVKDYTWQLAA